VSPGARRTIALTHVPSPRLVDGERTFVDRVAIDFERALEQHAAYRAMLERCGAAVTTLDVNRDHPDSVFLEDTAIVLDEVAVITPMGVASRRPEPPGIAAKLRQYRETREIELPATIEGGDVLLVGRVLLAGLSSRTNEAGIAALRSIAAPFGYDVTLIPMREALHFKSACTRLPDGKLLVNPAWLDPAELAGFDVVSVPATDPWGANVALVGSFVCAAAEHAPTNDKLTSLGYDVRATPLSEFAKAEGAVTCMSLIFDV
jgi:dimethylargininase